MVLGPDGAGRHVPRRPLFRLSRGCGGGRAACPPILRRGWLRKFHATRRAYAAARADAFPGRMPRFAASVRRAPAAENAAAGISRKKRFGNVDYPFYLCLCNDAGFWPLRARILIFLRFLFFGKASFWRLIKDQSKRDFFVYSRFICLLIVFLSILFCFFYTKVKNKRRKLTHFYRKSFF